MSRSADDHPALRLFEPGIRSWFAETFPAPTNVQALAWPVIAAGEHVLATAPTGSGKTLTAFLWALNGFAAGRSETGATRVLYVSPLKALNNDIQRNLVTPLTALEARGAIPHIRAQTRSGDTPQGDRQRMLRKPPEILITTPESLSLMLTTTRGRFALGAVETVILDEVHALADNRRGTLVFTALERLVHIAGEFQRVALSATVRPLAAVAAHVAGFDVAGVPRPIRVLEDSGSKIISLAVRFPERARQAADTGTKIWEPLAETFREIIASNQATLFFANSRRLAERLTAAINQDQREPLAYAHHGSLSREIRIEVEERLKRGALKAIVATSSLEMGIDIGALDEVVLIQSPPSIAATLQRIGRAGHRVGEVSRGTLFPTFAQDFVAAAALTAAVAERDIEPLECLTNPLDVLCQIIVSVTATEPWTVEGLYALLTRSGSYHTLPRAHFDLVLEMLAGRYAGTRVRELTARITYDRIRGRIEAQHAAVLALYSSGGVIPDRGYYQIRHLESGTVIGELDEEFVWEATTGQVFSLGTQNWQIHRITHNDVVVRPTASSASAPPFWRADARGRSFHYSEHILGFLAHAEALLAADDAEGLRRELTRARGFDAVAADELVLHLKRQRQATGAPLPHRTHLLAERVLAGPGGYRGPDHLEQLVLHSGWGGQVNRPWALALGAALKREGIQAAIYSDDSTVALETREPVEPEHVLRLVTPANLQQLLRASLEGSGFFGARFREAAGRALLLTRQRFNARLPLWMSRLQAKKLMSTVAGFSDFPVLLETWRTCLNDEFDLPALSRCLADLEDGATAVSVRVTATPSPFAGNSSFAQINRHMYATDRPEHQGTTSLSDELIRSAVFDAALRPRLEPATVTAFEAKRQRTAPGYEPESTAEWAEWIKERVLVPAAEVPDHVEHEDLARLSRGQRMWLCHRELLHVLVTSGLAEGVTFAGSVPEVADPRSALQLALEVLSFYGPLTERRIDGLLPSRPEGLLDDDTLLIRGPLMAGDDTVCFCDPDNLESMLRMQRASRRVRTGIRPMTRLPEYLAGWQGLPDAADLESALEVLRGYEAPVSVWLYDLPAARSPGEDDHRLDAALAVLGFGWQGAGVERIRVGFPEDLTLLEDAPAPPQEEGSAFPAEVFADPAAGYGFLQLADRQAAPLSEFNERWWQAVWRGELCADSLAPLRQGLGRGFKLGAWERLPGGGFDGSSRSGDRSHSALDRSHSALDRSHSALDRSHGALDHSRHRARHRARGWRHARAGFGEGWSGTWFLLPRAPLEADALTDLEDAKERVRLLLDRYGIVNRELANREGGTLRWAALFRALRVMELAGEVVAGYFFEGLSGPQFVTPGALRALEESPAAPGDFWCNALDPVSPCGLGLDWPELPQRRPQNYLAFHGGALALVVENLGKRLCFHVAPEAATGAVLAPLRFLLSRHRRVSIESVNGAPARESAYLTALGTAGRLVSDHRGSYLEAF